MAVAAGGLPAGRSSELVVMFNESLRDLNRLLMCCLSFARARVAPARLRAPPEHSVRLLVAPVFSRVTVFTRFVYTVAPSSDKVLKFLQLLDDINLLKFRSRVRGSPNLCDPGIS